MARNYEIISQSFNFSFQVGGGRWDDQCIREISPLFSFFFLLEEYPFGAKRKWGVPFCLLFLKEVFLEIIFSER